MRWSTVPVRACALLACAVAALAHAGEIMLYEQAGFGGRSLTLRSTAPNLETIDFNDRAVSVRVRAGVWELCTDAYFRGQCTTFGPGEYPNLGGRNGSYSSVRELAAGSWSRPPPQSSGEGAIVLFDQEGFRGRGYGINAAISDFAPTGFNDRTRSVIVKSGTW